MLESSSFPGAGGALGEEGRGARSLPSPTWGRARPPLVPGKARRAAAGEPPWASRGALCAATHREG